MIGCDKVNLNYLFRRLDRVRLYVAFFTYHLQISYMIIVKKKQIKKQIQFLLRAKIDWLFIPPEVVQLYQFQEWAVKNTES